MRPLRPGAGIGGRAARPWRLAALGLLVAGLSPVAAPAVAAGGDVPLSSGADVAAHPCRVPGLAHEVRCGSVARPLDPARPDGPRIDLHYVVVPALARHRLPDPVVLLAGGPGQSAITLAPAVMPLFGRLQHRRDIVFVDQRGTGRSAPLACEQPVLQSLAEASDRASQLRQLAACRERLQALPYGDLRQFTTPIAMTDLDAVRQSLGVEAWNLVGVSYGTRAGLEYLRQFPQAVRRAVLDSVAPPDMALPASASADAQAVLDAMFDACAGDEACRRRLPDLRGDWSRLLASLPREVEARHPLTGAPERFRLDRGGLMQSLRGPLYAPSTVSALPEAIHDAAEGRFEGLLGLASVGAPSGPAALAFGQHLSVICAEDMPRLADRPPAPTGRDFGDEILQGYVEACRDWPAGPVPPAFYTLGRSARPVLLLAGTLDPVTPPVHARRVAEALGLQARLQLVPNAGHGLLSLPCMADVLTRFIAAADDAAALAVEAGCADTLPRPPAFVPLGRGAAP